MMKALLRNAIDMLKSHGLFSLSQRKSVAASSVQTSAVVEPPSIPRLLYIDSTHLTPDADAGSLAAWNLLKIYRQLGFEVAFIAQDLSCNPQLEHLCGQQGIAVYLRLDDLDAFLESPAGSFDFYILSRPRVATKYFDKIRALYPNAKIIYNAIYIHFMRMLSQHKICQKSEILAEAMEYKKMELDLLSRADVSLVVSDTEMQALAQLGITEKLVHNPHLFFEPPIKNPIDSFEERSGLVFLGGFRHPPNEDAMLHFCETIFPELRKRLPGIRLNIVGSNATEKIARLGRLPGIYVHGQVENLEGIFSQVRLSIAPLRYGAGIKGKVVSSLAYGVPVIASSVAADGFTAEQLEGVWVAASDEEFVDGIVKLYTDEKLWQEYSDAAMTNAGENFSRGAGRRRVADMMSRLQEGMPLFDYEEFTSLEDYGRYKAAHEPMLKARRAFEERFVEKAREGQSTRGLCTVCGCGRDFGISVAELEHIQGGGALNIRESLLCPRCGNNNRWRAMLHYLAGVVMLPPHSRVFSTGALSPCFRVYQQRYPHIVGSEFFGDAVPPGASLNSIRNEDLEALSFADESFDCVVSQDDLEHVPHIRRALEEIFRVLKPGGLFVFTAPFNAGAATTLKRAELTENGEVRHLLPPEYHGDPVHPEVGCLSYRVFGWDLLESLEHVGFEEVKAVNYWSAGYLYLGADQFILTARRPG